MDSGESTALLKRTKIPLWLLSTALLVCPVLGHKMISQDMATEQSTALTIAAMLMYGGTLYGERLHVLSSMVQSNCLGERAPPSLVLGIRHYRVQQFVNLNVFFSQIIPVLQVEYGRTDMAQDPMENFNRCARRYTANKGKSRTATGQQLLIQMYMWVLLQYRGGEAHLIHRHLICLSFSLGCIHQGHRRQEKAE